MGSAAPRLCEDSFTVVRDDFESIIRFLRSSDAAGLAHHNE
jgi:hypothetical protein